MFPLRDTIPSYHTPLMTWTIVAINVAAFLATRGMSIPAEMELMHLYGVVPARFLHPEWAAWHGYPEGGAIALITHMFLHAGWLHIIANMWTMWVFADNVEDVMGPLRFAAFYFTCGLIALGAHVILNANSTVPVVGASGAIAGLMGGYFRLYPHARVVTFLPILFFPMLFELPAVLFLGLWFLSQVFSGMLAGPEAGGVAWWAHIGGFVAGMFLVHLFRNPRRCTQCLIPPHTS